MVGEFFHVRIKLFFILFEIGFINKRVGGIFHNARNTVFAACFRCVALRMYDTATVRSIEAEAILAALIDVDLKRCVSLFLRYAVFHQQ